MYTELKKKMNELRKAGMTTECNVLSVVIGDADREIARGKKITEDFFIKNISKLIESNNIILEKKDDTKLKIENNFLSTLLPTFLSTEELIDAIKKSEVVLGSNKGLNYKTILAFCLEHKLYVRNQEIMSAIEQLS